MPDRRLLIASNRLPVSADLADGRVRLSPASGGLATGLREWYARSSGTWIGWPGTVARLPAAQRRMLDAQLTDLSIVPVYLTRREVREYYEEFSNGVLWPVFHYLLLDRLPLEAATWESYRRVNERFAECIAEHYR